MTESNRDLIEEAVTQPKKVEVDGRVVEQHSLTELIEVDKYLAGKKAVRQRRNPLQITRFSAGGAV